MAEEKFILVSLKEEESKKLAQVISNDTSRKILDFLAGKKDSTETEISKELKIPISTVHYSLSQLVTAGLVQINEYHYSEKGKEVNHYSLANKYAIISPVGTSVSFREKLQKILPVLGIGLLAGGALYLAQIFTKLSLEKAALQAASAPVPDAIVPLRSMPPIVPSASPGAENAVLATMKTAGVNAASNITNATANLTDEASASMLASSSGMAADAAQAAADTMSGPQELAANAQAYGAGGNSFFADILANSSYWFIFGVVFTVLVFVIVDYIREKKKKAGRRSKH